ncbi:glutaminyl-peptide cyclotransferase [Marinifilum sp. N1E240]|nr:glutaminyl-peptide cyclotransferase [Marinifilum sp. N1E240]
MGKHKLKLLAYHENGKIGLVNTYVNIKSNQAPDEYGFEIVNSFPHDRRAYTQGLFYHQGFLYEGTGQHGESSLRKVKLENGEALSIKNLEQEYFGEGITLSKNRIIQLTWNSRKVFVVDPETFEKIDSFEPNTTNNQGWGITNTNNELIISDGTNVLTVLDDTNFGRIRTIEVYDNAGKVTNLNELEYIDGKIYANVWLSDRIVIINPKTGRVEGNINLGSILKQSEKNKLDKNDDVLNGIAWDSLNQRMFVTGKRWPKLFEIKISKK